MKIPQKRKAKATSYKTATSRKEQQATSKQLTVAWYICNSTHGYFFGNNSSVPEGRRVVKNGEKSS